MRCKTAQRCLSAGLDGELGATRERLLRTHLTTCCRCQTFAANIDRLGTMLDTVSVADPRWGFAERMVARIADVEASMEPKTGWLRRLRPFPVGVGVAAFCAGMALVVLANGQTELDATEPGDPVTVLAVSYFGTSATPAMEDGLVDLLPTGED